VTGAAGFFGAIDAVGIGTRGVAAVGQNAVGAAGGDVTDNTSIGSINIRT